MIINLHLFKKNNVDINSSNKDTVIMIIDHTNKKRTIFTIKEVKNHNIMLSRYLTQRVRFKLMQSV